MNNIDVSVIIPVYNVKQYLTKCIESVLQQSLSNFELILVDDGSTDGSGELCDKYALHDARIKVIHLINGGVSRARNEGIKNANGQQIVFIDGDDWIEDSYLSELYRLLIENNADISVVGFISDDEKHRTEYSIFTNEKQLTGKESLDYIADIQKPWVGFAGGKMYRSSLIKELSFNEKISICEDSLFNCYAMLKANKVAVSHKCLYNYRIRLTSATLTANAEKLLTKIHAFELIWSEAIQYPESDFYYRVLSVLVTTYIYYLTIYSQANRFDKDTFNDCKTTIRSLVKKLGINRLMLNAKIKLLLLFISSRLFYIVSRGIISKK